MRKSIKWIIAVTFAAFAVIGCAKQGDLEKVVSRVDNIENRVGVLEEAVKQLNETDVPGLRDLVRAIQNNITVTSVVETEDGYTINFSDGTTAVLRNGKNGQNGRDGVDGVDGTNGKDGVDGTNGTDGQTPVIGITLVDGVYVWTVNGEILKDDSGKPIPVTGNDGKDGVDGTNGTNGTDGITPLFGILDGHWVVSYDNGDTWKTLGLTSDTDYSAYIDPDKETDDYIVLVVGATEVQIPKEKAFTLTFTTIENNGVNAGETAAFPYTIAGVNASDETDVDVIGIIGDWTAEVVPTDNASGVLNVTATENGTAKVTVYAANHKGKADIRTLKFEGGVLEAIIETHDISWEGGELDLLVRTNVAYDVVVPAAAQEWISVAPATRVRVDSLVIAVAKNETGSYRQATLQVVDSKGTSVKDIEILQYANPEAATDLASVAALPDDKAVAVNQVTVVAASKVSTIVTDGEAFMYVTNYTGTPGTVIDVTGTKKTDDFELAFVESSDVKVNAEAEPVEVDKKANYYYYGYGANGFTFFYTANNGVVSEKDGVYYVTAYEEPQQFVIEDPTQDLSSLVGKFVAMSGWVKVVDYERDVKEDIITVLTDIHEIVFTEETGWKPYYAGMTSDDEDYPEVIGNEVSNPTEDSYYELIVIDAAEAAATYESMDEMVATVAYNASDDLLWYLSRYAAFGYDFVFNFYTHNESAEDTLEELDYGAYYLLAVGLDAEGRISGKYAVTTFEKKDPSVFANYEDFLGEWILAGNTIEIAAKENGKTYSITGLPGYDGNNYLAVEAVYDAEKGKLLLYEQALKDYTNSNYGACKRIFQGVFTYSGTDYGFFWFNSEDYDDEPQVILTGSLLNTGEVNLAAGSCPYGKFTGFRYAWVIVNESSPYYRNGGAQSTVALPNLLTRPQVDLEAYNKWLGNWTVGTDSWTIEKAEEGKTFTVTGICGTDIPYEARFNSSSNEFELYEQETDVVVEVSVGGTPTQLVVCLFGEFVYSDGNTYYLGSGNKMASAALPANGTTTLTPAPTGYGMNFSEICTFGFDPSTGKVYGLTDGLALPASMSVASGSSVKPASIGSPSQSATFAPVSAGKFEEMAAMPKFQPSESISVRKSGKSYSKAFKF
ncbi:MAG: hypothetical protein II851_04775 [Bacteroidales bacterium]|nr:hypothetical protein [Bacteroidales bacterium]